MVESTVNLLICSLAIPPHVKYVTTVPRCNLSLLTALFCDSRSFSDTNVSQDSVAIHRPMKRGGIFNKSLAANLLENLTVKKIVNRLRINRLP